MNTRTWISVLTLAALFTGNVHAQTSYPMVTHTVPLAVQRGATTEVTVHGLQNFAGAFAVYVAGDGVTSEIVPQETKDGKAPERATSVKLKVTVSEDAVLGPREYRIAAAHGVSSVGQLVVTDHPVVQETGKHATLETAQPIEVGQVVSGIVTDREEVDYYKFSAKAGQQVVFEICSARLMFKIHDLQNHFDPILTVYDSTGREIASNDDYYFADSMIAHQFDKDGEYYVSVRDVRFHGDRRWSYALLVSDRPYVTAVFPMAVAVNGPRQVQAVGFNLVSEAFEVPLAEGVAPGSYTVQLGEGSARTNAVVVEATDLPLMTEQEPNNELQKDNAASLPVGVNGVIQADSDVDYFTFDLKKGDAVRFEVKARRNGSSLDSSLRLLNDKGGVVAATDDFQSTKDSVLVAKIPADGKYHVELRDLLNRGGPTFGYFLEARYDLPNFELTCDDDKAGLGPGGSAPWFIKATRSGGFTGPIEVRVEGLPGGVSVNPLTIPESMTEGCLVLTATPDAKPSLQPVRVIGKAAVELGGESVPIERQAIPVSEIYVPGGGRGQWHVQTHMVGVHPQDDIAAVKVTPDKISLKPGEKIELNVEVLRRDVYKGRVTLDTRLRHLGRVYADPLPPGVTVVENGSKTSLNPDESKGKIILQAAPNAKPIENVPITVLANVSINFVVKRAYASAPVLVSVAGDDKVAAK